MQNTLIQPLSNVQIEILKVFSHKLQESELLELRKHLGIFFAKRLINEADKVWDKENWDDKKVNDLLNTKIRNRV